MKLKNKLEIDSTLKVGALPTASTSNYSVLFENGGLVSKRTVGNIINYNSSDFISGISNSFPSIFNYNTSTTATDPSLVVSFKNQLAGTVLAAPATLNGTPSFRKLIDSDLSETSIFSQLGNYVPYIGATQNVDIEENQLITRTDDPDSYFKAIKIGIFENDSTALGIQVETASPILGPYNSPYIFDVSGSLSRGADFVAFNAPNEGGMAFRHRNDYFDQLTYKNGRLTLGERWDYVNSTHKLRVKGTGIFTSTLQSTGFIRTGSNNNYVLLGGGGHKLVSDFALSTDIPDVSNFLKKDTANTVTQDFEITNGPRTLRVGAGYGSIRGEFEDIYTIDLGTDDGYAVIYNAGEGHNFGAYTGGIHGVNNGNNWGLENHNVTSRMLMPETGNTQRVLTTGAKLGSNTYYANTQGIVELPEYPSVSGFVPYTGADQPINFNTQTLNTEGLVQIQGVLSKTQSSLEMSRLVGTTASNHLRKYTDVASASRGNDTSTLSDCVVIKLPIRTSTRWVMEVDIFGATSISTFSGAVTLLIAGYSTNNSQRVVSVIGGDSDKVKSVSFCRDEQNNSVIIVRFESDSTNFSYGKVNINKFYHGVTYNSDLDVKSNFSVSFEQEESLTGLTTNGTVTNERFTRDSYLWNKGNFSQTNIDNWNTAFGWGRGIKIDGNGEAVHNMMTLDANLVKNSSMWASYGSANIPNYGANKGAPIVNFTPYKTGTTEYGFSISARENRILFNTKEASVVGDWLELYHTGNLTNVSQLNNDAGYITSSSLPTNYITTNSNQTGLTGNKTTTGIWTFNPNSHTSARFEYTPSDNVSSGIRLDNYNIAGSKRYADFSINAELGIAGIGYGSTGGTLPNGSTSTSNFGMWVNSSNDLFAGRNISANNGIVESLNGFSKTGATNNDVLLGSGGHRPVSDFALASSLSGYFPVNFNNTIHSVALTSSNGDLLNAPTGTYSAQVSTTTPNRPFHNTGGLISFGAIGSISTRILGARDNSDNLWFQSGDGTGAWRQLASREWVNQQGFLNQTNTIAFNTTAVNPTNSYNNLDADTVLNSSRIFYASGINVPNSAGFLDTTVFSNGAFQMSQGDNDNFYYRRRFGGTWRSWNQVASREWVNQQGFSTQTLANSTSNLIVSNTVQRAALTGDVTAAQNSNVTTIANSAVTHAKYQNIATQRILGRGAAGAGNVQELTLGSNLSLSTSGVLSATDTTYSAGTLALLQAGTNTTNRVWPAKVIADYVISMIPTSTDSILSYSSAGGIIVTDWNSYALSEYAISLGYGSVTSGNYATSVGGLLSTTGFGSTNQGYSNSITKSLGYALGAYNSVRATLSGAFGIGLVNRNDGAFVVGRYNAELPIEPYDTTVPHKQAVFAIGAGRDDTDRYTALTVYGDGRADYTEGYDDSNWTDNTLVTKKWVQDNAGGGSGGGVGYRNVNQQSIINLSAEYNPSLVEYVFNVRTERPVVFIGGNEVFHDGYKVTIMTNSDRVSVSLDSSGFVKFIDAEDMVVPYVEGYNSITFIYDKEYSSFRVYHKSFISLN